MKCTFFNFYVPFSFLENLRSCAMPTLFLLSVFIVINNRVASMTTTMLRTTVIVIRAFRNDVSLFCCNVEGDSATEAFGLMLIRTDANVENLFPLSSWAWNKLMLYIIYIYSSIMNWNRIHLFFSNKILLLLTLLIIRKRLHYINSKKMVVKACHMIGEYNTHGSNKHWLITNIHFFFHNIYTI